MQTPHPLQPFTSSTLHSPLVVLMIVNVASHSGSNSTRAIVGHAAQQFPQALHLFSLMRSRKDISITQEQILGCEVAAMQHTLLSNKILDDLNKLFLERLTTLQPFSNISIKDPLNIYRITKSSL